MIIVAGLSVLALTALVFALLHRTHVTTEESSNKKAEGEACTHSNECVAGCYVNLLKYCEKSSKCPVPKLGEHVIGECKTTIPFHADLWEVKDGIVTSMESRN